MVNKKSNGEKVFSVCNVLIMLLIIVITLYPMYYVLVCSLSKGQTWLVRAVLFCGRKDLIFPRIKRYSKIPISSQVTEQLCLW